MIPANMQHDSINVDIGMSIFILSSLVLFKIIKTPDYLEKYVLTVSDMARPLL